jgi:hypothetical protein
VTDFTAENMKIKLVISEKLYVSTGDSLDTLYFKFVNNTIFLTENDVKMANTPQMEIGVQRQMESEEVFEAMQKQAEEVAQTMWIFLILFLCLKILKIINADAILSTIGMMQLIIHDKELRAISLPAPTQLTF